MVAVTKKLLLAAAAFALTFAIIEGLASEALLAYQLFLKPSTPLAERLHTRYDPELGWVALPSVTIPDMYGPGIGFRSNAKGFRNDRDFEGPPESGRLRAVCVGDSFTLGYGVDGAHNWCALLPRLDPRLETVNMGQGGYGIDQAYLWYRRESETLLHQIVLFAFITADFNRMQRSSFLGHAKPLLRVHDGRLAVENVPVPQAAFRFNWLVTRLPALQGLRLVKFAGGLYEQFVPSEESLASRPPTEEAAQLAGAIFAALADRAREAGATLVLVYLPTQDDFERQPLTDAWREIVAEEAKRLSIAHVDLVEPARERPGTVRRLFIARKQLRFAEGAGHYTEAGNDVVAHMLLERLVALPEIAQRLQAASPRP